VTFVFRTLCSQRHQRFDPAGLARFEQMQGEGYLNSVYENEKVRIYQVKGVKDNACRTRHSDRY
jgi:hypothetical protein